MHEIFLESSAARVISANFTKRSSGSLGLMESGESRYYASAEWIKCV
jgi:hypothetical protein